MVDCGTTCDQVCHGKHNQSPQNERINIGFLLILILETGEH